MVESAPATKSQFTQAALNALTSIDELLSDQTPNDTLVSPSELYAYAADGHYQPSDKLLNALNGNPKIRDSFHQLLRNTARYHLPQVAAASSGAIKQREAGGCKISFHDSKANDQQMYVIIESPGHLDFGPNMLFVCNPEGASSRIELPVAQNGRIQLLLERESEMAKELLNIKTEVYLK